MRLAALLAGALLTLSPGGPLTSSLPVAEPLASSLPAAEPRPLSLAVAEPWQPVPGLGLDAGGGLFAVTALGRDVWVGGAELSGRPLVARWDGTRWTRAALTGRFPVKTLTGTGPGSLWAAGPVGDQSRSDAVRSSAFHWDGKRWTRATWLPAAGMLVNELAADGEQVTAVGSDHDALSVATWNGHEARMAHGPRAAVEAVASGDGHTWLAGTRTDASCRSLHPALWHRPRPDAPFAEVATPAVPDGRLKAIARRGTSEVWAVGGIGGTPDQRLGVWCGHDVVPPGETGMRPLVLRGDGTTWRQVELPGWSGMLLDVAVSPESGVWAAGIDPGRPGEVMILHYDGAWSREYVRVGGSMSGLELAVAGSVPWIVGGNERPFVMRRTG